MSAAPPPPPPPPPSKQKAKAGPPADFNPNADENAPRDVYLVVYKPLKWALSNAGRAHWRIFVPYVGCSEKGPGTTIEVVGGPFQGYHVEFIRHFDFHESRTKPKAFVNIGKIDVKHIHEPKESGKSSKPEDDLETCAMSVPAPSRPKKPKNAYSYWACQGWTHRFVKKAVEDNLLPQTAIAKLEQAEHEHNIESPDPNFDPAKSGESSDEGAEKNGTGAKISEGIHNAIHPGKHA